MLTDAAEVRGESGFWAAVRTLRMDLVRHSSRLVKIVVSLLIVAVAFGSAYLGGAMGSKRMHQSQERLRVEQSAAIAAELAAMRDELRLQLEEFLREQGGRASRADLDALRADLARKGAVVDSLIARNDALRRVLDEYSRGVCLIYGAYTFHLPGEAGSASVLGPDGNPLEIEYMGSGFLASPEGFVLTNRHMVEPWWNNSAVSGLMEQGAVPALVRLLAYFPGQGPLVIDPTTIRISGDGVDVALLRVGTDDVKSVPASPMYTGDVRDLRGNHVILLGYPTGINAVLARAEQNVVNDIIASVSDTNGLLGKLADLSLIAPVITQGALNEVRERRLVYDAETTSGGSGGPVFGLDGTVIGINFAITRDFAGSNFGIPIAFAQRLLAQVQGELQMPPQ